MEIRISNVQAMQYGDKFDATIGGITIKGCQHKQGTNAKGEYEFIALPQYRKVDKEGKIVKKKDGKDMYFCDIELSKELADKLLVTYKEEKQDIPF